MELKHIKELMAAMTRTGTKRLSLKKDGFELELEREENGHAKSVDTNVELDDYPLRHELTSRANIALSRGRASSLTPSEPAMLEKDDSANIYITSPMVGTFYSAPSPDDPFFVKIGDKVEKGSVVCIIEAMKVMNEVKSSVVGTVAEILVENGHPVEFGTKLYRLT